MPPETAQSIYALPPLETGGSRSRQGLAFQDHVTVGFCLDMLEGDQLAEVWCETQDDATLLWKEETEVIPEFVQAKSDELDQLWTTSKLCEREGGKFGSSIVERSLAYDRCREEAIFRFVTARPFKSELDVLTWDRRCAARIAAEAQLLAVQDALASKVGGFFSGNGNDCRQWARRALLDARHSERAVIDANLRKLRRVLERAGHLALDDQLAEIYARVAGKIAEAAALDARFRAAEKRFPRASFASLVEVVSNSYLRTPAPGGGKVLQEKMDKAGLPLDAILQAQELRRAYRLRSLTPRYQQPQDRPLLDEEVAALLATLKARLDSGALGDDGPEFFAKCLDSLAAFREALPANERPSLADLHGSMYSIADRCLHRFRRSNV